ncbi:MAG: glucuronyl hydrolase [Armatimonadota bacterium]
MIETIDNALADAAHQTRALLARHPADYRPMYTVGGRFGHDRKRWTHWCDGFLPGICFLLADALGAEDLLDAAIARSLPLEPRRHDRAVHDLGFLFHSTWLRWRALGGPADRIDAVLVDAGKTMAIRFMEKGQYLRSFVEPASCFIDIMMNVGTIFDAAERTGDPHLRAIAMAHCETTRRHLVRGDGSTAHEALFDTETGACLRQSTHQGFRGDSCWSRGLAWSLTGFARAYRSTGDPVHRDTARANAGFLLRICPDGIAPWDFDAPAEGPLSRTRIDTSSSAIAASGLFELADLCARDGLEVDAERYRGWALHALSRLCREHTGRGDDGFEGVLRDGVYHIHKGLGVGEAVAFGDHFFVESLVAARRLLASRLLPARTVPYPEDSLPAAARRWVDGPTEEDLPSPGEG